MQRPHSFAIVSLLVLSAHSVACDQGTPTPISATDASSTSSTGATGSTGDSATPTTSGASGPDSTTSGDPQTGSSGAETTTGNISSGTSTGTTGPGTTDSTGASTTTTGESTGTGADTTGADTTTGDVLLGSCRSSESYGSAGQRPAFTDPAYANFLDKQVAVTTTSVQATPYVLHIVDISGPQPPPNTNYKAPRYEHPDWTVDKLGRIFGLTLDSDGNIYVAATTVNGATENPGKIRRIDGKTGAITDLITLPNNGPALGNINYDCVSETIYASNHEDGRIYQIDLAGQVVSTYKHATKDVSLGLPSDPGEPDGAFVPLGERVWAVQSHAGRLYYGVWLYHSSLPIDDMVSNEVWSVAYTDDSGVPDPTTAKLEFKLPENPPNPVADISFGQTGRMILARRTMSGDMKTSAHVANVLGYDSVGGVWQPAASKWFTGEIVNSAAGGVDHDFTISGRLWQTADALDFYSPDIVYGLQGTPYVGGDIKSSTIIDLDGNIASQAKAAQGDVEVPIPDDAMPVAPPG